MDQRDPKKRDPKKYNLFNEVNLWSSKNKLKVKLVKPVYSYYSIGSQRQRSLFQIRLTEMKIS